MCYVMQWGLGGGGSNFQKNVTKVYGSMLLALRGCGGVKFSEKRRYITLDGSKHHYHWHWQGCTHTHTYIIQATSVQSFPMGSVIISSHVMMTSSFPTVVVCPWRRSYRRDDRSAADCRTVGWSPWCEWPVDWWLGESRDGQRPGHPALWGWTENTRVKLTFHLYITPFLVTYNVQSFSLTSGHKN